MEILCTFIAVSYRDTGVDLLVSNNGLDPPRHAANVTWHSVSRATTPGAMHDAHDLLRRMRECLDRDKNESGVFLSEQKMRKKRNQK